MDVILINFFEKTTNQAPYWLEMAGDWTPVFISLMALIYAVYSGKKQSKFNKEALDHQIEHNKLSVRPVLGAKDSTRYDGGCFLKISNDGYGPAIIHSVELPEGQENLSDYITLLAKKHYLKIRSMKLDLLEEGSIVAAGEFFNLIYYDPDPNLLDNSNTDLPFMLFLSDLKLVIKYQSIYKDSIKLLTIN